MSSVKLGPVLAKAFLELVRHLQVTRKKMGKFMDICQIEFVLSEVRGQGQPKIKEMLKHMKRG